jgi:hypothetical protein
MLGQSIFQVKKGDEFALTFTERFINDTIYDGVIA